MSSYAIPAQNGGLSLFLLCKAVRFNKSIVMESLFTFFAFSFLNRSLSVAARSLYGYVKQRKKGNNLFFCIYIVECIHFLMSIKLVPFLLQHLSNLSCVCVSE